MMEAAPSIMNEGYSGDKSVHLNEGQGQGQEKGQGLKSGQGQGQGQVFVKPRDGFRASPGYVLLAADYSQIELRIMAHFSK
jgi:DNA polymerase family A